MVTNYNPTRNESVEMDDALKPEQVVEPDREMQPCVEAEGMKANNKPVKSARRVRQVTVDRAMTLYHW